MPSLGSVSAIQVRLLGDRGADDPGRGRTEDRAVVLLEIGDRLADLAGELRAQPVDLVRRADAEQLGGGAEGHREGDRVIEVVADSDREIAAREGGVREAGDLELVRNGV